MQEGGKKRRAVLGGIAIGAIGGLAGCSTLIESTTPTASETPEPEIGDDTPVVGEGPAGPEAVTVDVKVVDRNGDPVADELVELEDRGGTPDDRTGRTGENGRLRFIEGVGGPPCNTQTVLLPDRGLETDLGCNNGGAELAYTFEVSTADVEIGDDTPVVGEGPAGPEAVTVDVRVVDRNGDPVADELVELEDRGGTPDDRTGRTGENGRLRFIEGVGGPPCNTQTVLLPDRGLETDLGCNNGGAELDHVFRVEQ